MRYILATLLLVFAVSTAHAQPVPPALGGFGCSNPATVAGLPTGVTGRICVVSDGASDVDCGTGGGSSVNICRYSGSAWVAIPDMDGIDGEAFIIDKDNAGATVDEDAKMCFEGGSGTDVCFDMVSGDVSLTGPAGTSLVSDSFTANDSVAEPGNVFQLNDNDTAFTNDPNCTNSCSAGKLCIIDKDETVAEDWVFCNGTTELCSLTTGDCGSGSVGTDGIKATQLDDGSDSPADGECVKSDEANESGQFKYEACVGTGAITSSMILNGTITTADIAAATIGASNMAPGGIETTALQDGGVALADMASSSVDSDNIVDGTIVAADMATDSINTTQLDDAADTPTAAECLKVATATTDVEYADCLSDGVDPGDMNDGDFGDFTFTTGVAALDADSINLAELDDGADTPLAGECLVVATATTDIEYVACNTTPTTVWVAPLGNHGSNNSNQLGTAVCDCIMFHLDAQMADNDTMSYSITGTGATTTVLEAGIFDFVGSTQYGEYPLVESSTGSKTAANDTAAPGAMAVGDYWFCISSDAADYSLRGTHANASNSQYCYFTQACAAGEMPATLTAPGCTWSDKQPAFFSLSDE